MTQLNYTLLGEGPSDQALLPLLTWLLRAHLPTVDIRASWADLHRGQRRPGSLADRILQSIDLHSCDLLFVHRDADREPRQARVEEVRRAAGEASTQRELPPTIPVVPVRMLEAWLLSDVVALRRAAGNPNGRRPLILPRTRDIESLPDPKERLRELILEASELSGRRRRRVAISAVRVAELTDDFSPLRNLSAFEAFETELRSILRTEGWS